MTNEIDFFVHPFGDRYLTIQGDISHDKMKAIEEYDFTELNIKYNSNKDLSCLRNIKKEIKSLSVHFLKPDSLESLVALESLTVLNSTGPYPELPKLRCLTLSSNKAWHPSIAQLENLEYLEVHGWPEKTLEPTSRMKNLIDLSLVDSRKVESLKGLNSLNTLSLAGCSKLVDCSDLGSVQGLQGLYIQSCKAIEDFAFLAELKHLVELYIDVPKLPSLSVLARLPELKSLCFANTLIEDLDVAIQTEFPALRLSAFRKKRGYNQTSEYLDEILSQKWGLPKNPWSKDRKTIIGYAQPRFTLSQT